MRAPSLLLRYCSISIFFIHLMILFSCLFHGIPTWNWDFQSLITPAVVGQPVAFIEVVFLALFQLGPLVFPPLAAWIAFRFPTQLLSLVGLWISLALTLMACLFFSWLLREPPFFFLWMPPGLSPLPDVNLILPLGFGLSSILCLALAIRLPLKPRSALRMSRAEALAVMGRESGERSGLAAARRPRAWESLGLRLRIAAALGLLCHLVIALSLFFPYVDNYDSYGWTHPTLTGWQLLGEPFQPAALRITTLMPPLSHGMRNESTQANNRAQNAATSQLGSIASLLALL